MTRPLAPPFPGVLALVREIEAAERDSVGVPARAAT
jgi:hypothetical protein